MILRPNPISQTMTIQATMGNAVDRLLEGGGIVMRDHLRVEADDTVTIQFHRHHAVGRRLDGHHLLHLVATQVPLRRRRHDDVIPMTLLRLADATTMTRLPDAVRQENLGMTTEAEIGMTDSGESETIHQGENETVTRQGTEMMIPLQLGGEMNGALFSD